jgi:hypothetical protein
LTVPQITELANKLALRSDRGLFTAIDLLAMVIHCTDKKDNQYKHELGEALREYLRRMNWSLLDTDRAQIDHHLGVVITFALQSAESESQVAPILRHMFPTDETNQNYYGDVRKNALKPFFKHFPRLALELICIPGEDGTFRRAKRLISDPYSDRHETTLGPFPTEVLLDWCNEIPDTRYAFIAGVCKLFEKRRDEKMPYAVSETAKALLAAAPDKAAVLSQFVRRLTPSSWSGSRADIMEARLSLLDQLVITGDEIISPEIAAVKENFQKSIDAERAHEKEEEKARNSSFE